MFFNWSSSFPYAFHPFTFLGFANTRPFATRSVAFFFPSLGTQTGLILEWAIEKVGAGIREAFIVIMVEAIVFFEVA